MIFEDDYETLEPQNSIPEPQIEYDTVGETKTIKFGILVKFFNNLSALRGAKKGTLVKKFIQKIFAQNRSPSFTYSIIRLILPNDDRERGNYGLKEKGMAKIVYETLNLSREKFDRLFHYKNPNYHKGGVGIGDFSICMYDVVKDMCKTVSNLTVVELNNLLDELASTSDQTIVFRNLFQKSNAEEIKWITRIILKDLKLGIKVETVLNTYHPDGNDFYNLTNSLLEMCRKFENPKVSLNDDVEIFHPIRPMLAGKKRIDFFKYQNRPWYIETKYDGQRLQVHYDIRQSQKVKFFSRNGVELNHQYEDFITYFQGSVQADSCILDGEMIVIQKNTHKMMHFGLNKTVAISRQAENLQLCYKVFDVLWVRLENQETNFMSIPLRQRKKILPRVVQEIDGRIEIVKFTQRNQYEQILQDFNDSIERNEEGIMCKDPTSCYIPKERGISWLKLKGEYVEGLTDNFDLIILGGYFGTVSFKQGSSNHWTDNITHFLVGVIDKLDEENPRKTTALALSRIGSGLSAEQLNELRAKLKPHLVEFDKKKPPKFFQKPWKHDIDHQPACWIDSLENSVVLQVKASEIMESNVFPTNMTLRFPRIVRVREDKDWKDAMTKADLDQMNDDEFYTKGLKRKQPTEGQGAGSDSDGGQTEGNKGRKRFKKFRTKKIMEKIKNKQKVDIMGEFKPTDVSGEKLKSHLFTGIEFNVLPPPSSSDIEEYETKSYIEKLILLNGGKITQNPVSTTKYVVAREMDLRLELYLKNQKKSYIYVKPIYIVSCVQSQQILPLSPLYLTIVPKGNEAYYRDNFDKYGDSFTNYIDARELEIILKNIPDPDLKTLGPDDIVTENEQNSINFQIDQQLMDKLCLPESRKGKISICYGIDELSKIKLRMQGNKFVKSFAQKPNSVICSLEVTNQELEGLQKYIKNIPDDYPFQLQNLDKLIEKRVIS